MKVIFYIAVVFFLSVGISVSAAPTFADLAVLMAKGSFKQYVEPDASLEECVAFLNSNGIQFSMFDMLDPNVAVKKEDMARVVGQSRLLFLGEAELRHGGIRRPEEAASWIDYCLLNDVDLDRLWNGFVEKTKKTSLPEVRRFFE